MLSDYNIPNGKLYHHGIKGQKWGVKRTPQQLGYRSTSIRSALSRRSNDKVDKSFKEWKENSDKRNNAIELGKKATQAKRSYENNKSDKNLRKDYAKAKKDYKNALKQNTTYRKGVVKQEVGRDAARKYLSDAKKVKKKLDQDTSNKKLKKQYSDLMSKHDIERARARRATEVSANRSQKKASIKRTMTITVKAALTSSAIAAGTYAVNRYLSSHNTTLNGKPIRINNEKVKKYADIGKKIIDFGKYVY